MGTLAIIISGFIGAVAASRIDFSRSWILLVNLSFSLYAAVFLTSPAVSLLTIPDLADGYKKAIALGGIFLVMNFVLKWVVEQVWSDPELADRLPKFPAKIASLLAGFFSGALLVSAVMLCFVQTPVSDRVAFRKDLQSASGKTLRVLVKTLNGFSWQWTDTEKMPELKALGIIPSAEDPAGRQVREPEKTPEEKPRKAGSGTAGKRRKS